MKNYTGVVRVLRLIVVFVMVLYGVVGLVLYRDGRFGVLSVVDKCVALGSLFMVVLVLEAMVRSESKYR